MMMQDPHAIQSDGATVFPFKMVVNQGEWNIAWYDAEAQCNQLLRPGWQWENCPPYAFQTAEAGWAFLKGLIQFYSSQQRLRESSDMSAQLENCRSCGVLFRTKVIHYCRSCLQKQPDLLHELCQGILHKTGSKPRAFGNIAHTLHIPSEKVAEKVKIVEEMKNRGRSSQGESASSAPKLSVSAPTSTENALPKTQRARQVHVSYVAEEEWGQRCHGPKSSPWMADLGRLT